MNTGTPTDEEKDQVKLNQQASTDTSRPAATDDGASAMPPPTASPPPLPPNPPPAPSPPSTIPPLADTEQKKQNIGIGTKNIGVEENLKPKPPQPVMPMTAPPSAPSQTTPPPPPPDEKATIEVQTTDIPIKSYTREESTQTPALTPLPAKAVPPALPKQETPTPQSSSTLTPPIKGTLSVQASSGPTATIVVLAILALIFGTAGGFFGFRFWDKLKTSASTTVTPSASTNGASTQQTYTNDKYKFSLNFPVGWVASTIDPQAEDIVFAANQESLAESPSGYRVEIVFQDSQGKTLKSWVEANAVTTNEKKPIKEITISQATAYQQEQTNIRPAVATYLEQSGKIMIVTYTAPPASMAEGGDFYNDIINSITFI